MAVEFVDTEVSKHIDTVKALFTEYAIALDINCETCYDIVTGGFSCLDSEFAPPNSIIMALYNKQIAGCIGIKQINDDLGEIVRFFVRKEFRNKGIGKGLLNAALQYGIKKGFKYMYLQTLTFMKEAISLYRSYGFIDTKPYKDNLIDVPNTVLPGAMVMKIDMSLMEKC